MNDNNIQKPISILREELINGIAKLIYDSKLSVYIIEPMINDLLTEIRGIRDKQIKDEKEEYELAKAQYAQQLQMKNAENNVVDAKAEETKGRRTKNTKNN